MRKTLLSLLVGASFLTVPSAYAQEGHKMEDMKGMVMPTMTSPLTNFETALAEAEKAATAKNLEIMHKYSETMAEALTSLQATDAAKDPLVASTLTQAIPVAKSLDTVGDAGDLPGTLSVLKKLQGVDAVLKARLPAPIDHGTPDKHGANDHGGASSLHAAAVGFDTLKSGQENTLTLKLTDAEGQPVPLDALQEVHTKKVHWLVVDETLSDYHHLHPVAGSEAGTYVAAFTPEKSGTYKVWTDVTPVDGSQQFLPVELKGTTPCTEPCVTKTLSDKGETAGLTATLTFDKPLVVGSAAMGKVTITDKDGKPVADLEPVMGAFAHVVAFYDDFATVAHVHPMGAEPTADTQRGGPDLMFHLEPAKAGFLKIYVQINRAGQNVFIPLGVNVK